MTSALEQLQEVAVNQIATDGMFDGSQSINGQVIPVITEKKGDILTQINTDLGKIGLCVVVLTPVFDLPGWRSVSLRTLCLILPVSDQSRPLRTSWGSFIAYRMAFQATSMTF